MDGDTIQLIGQGLFVVLTSILAFIGSTYQAKKSAITRVADANTDNLKRWEESVAKIALLTDELYEVKEQAKKDRELYIEERGGLKRELELVREELKKVRKERDDYFEKWTSERLETRTQIITLEKQVEQLQNKVDQLEKDLARTQKEKDELQRELNKKIAEAVAEATIELNKKIAELEKQIEEKDKLIAEYRSKIGEA